MLHTHLKMQKNLQRHKRSSVCLPMRLHSMRENMAFVRHHQYLATDISIAETAIIFENGGDGMLSSATGLFSQNLKRNHRRCRHGHAAMRRTWQRSSLSLGRNRLGLWRALASNTWDAFSDLSRRHGNLVVVLKAVPDSEACRLYRKKPVI